MINSMLRALIKKDIRNITSNKRMFSVLLIVPLVLIVVLPVIFLLTITLAPMDADDFRTLLSMLPPELQNGDIKTAITGLVLNKILPVFFLLIPVMAASVMAASSFVGEKEKRTLETLLYSPLSLRQIYRAKILASFIISMIVSFLSFAVMLIVFEAGLLILTGAAAVPDIGWLVVMLLVSPAVTFIAITLIVRGSAKARSVEDSQQRSVFLILPIIALAVGQFTGVLLLNVWVLLGLGIVFAAAAFILVRVAWSGFTYEKLLK